MTVPAPLRINNTSLAMILSSPSLPFPSHPHPSIRPPTKPQPGFSPLHLPPPLYICLPPSGPSSRCLGASMGPFHPIPPATCAVRSRAPALPLQVRSYISVNLPVGRLPVPFPRSRASPRIRTLRDPSRPSGPSGAVRFLGSWQLKSGGVATPCDPPGRLPSFIIIQSSLHHCRTKYRHAR